VSWSSAPRRRRRDAPVRKKRAIRWAALILPSRRRTRPCRGAVPSARLGSSEAKRSTTRWVEPPSTSPAILPSRRKTTRPAVAAADTLSFADLPAGSLRTAAGTLRR